MIISVMSIGLLGAGLRLSSNGTVLVNEAGAQQVLRRDKVTLGESGKICLGGRPEDNTEGVMIFECK